MGNENLGSTESLLSSTLLKERGEFMDPGLTEELKRLEEKLEFLAKAEESLLLKTREFEEQLRASRKREQVSSPSLLPNLHSLFDMCMLLAAMHRHLLRLKVSEWLINSQNLHSV